MKKVILGLLLLCSATALRAQTGYTEAAGYVLDPTGAPYSQCKGSAAFVPSPTATTVPLLNGSTFQTDVPINSCDSFGHMTITLADNNFISDGHTGSVASMWNFAITSQDGKTSFQCKMTITGSTQVITSQLQACAPLLPGGGGGGGSGNGLIYRFQPILGTALTSGDFALTGWGTGATITNITGTDTDFQFTITAGTSPNTCTPTCPSVVLTYHDGPWISITSTEAWQNNGTGSLTFVPTSSTLTSLTMTYQMQPVAGSTYTINGLVMGSSTGSVLPPVVEPVVINPTATQTVVQPSSTALSVNYFDVTATQTNTNAGVFTNTQENQPFTNVINGLNFHAMDPYYLTDAFAGGVEIPSSSTVTQSDGVSGWCEVQSTATNCVGLFGVARNRVASGNIWGLNTIASDTDSLGTPHVGKITGYEDDMGCTQVGDTCFGILIIGAVGNATPTVGGGVRIGSLCNFSVSCQWPYAFGTDPGITSTWGIVNAACSTGTCASQNLVFYSNLSSAVQGGTFRLGSIGDFEFQPQSGQGFNFGSLTAPRGVIEAGVSDAAPDALNVVPTHGFNISDEGNLGIITGVRTDTSSFEAWIQARDLLAASQAYIISLNPLGGRILMGTATDDGTHELQVNGGVSATSFTGNNIPLIGTLTTTSATSDVATVTGATASSHCWAQATNATAAALTGVYLSSPTTNAVTVNHSATSGGTFNVFCTPN